MPCWVPIQQPLPGIGWVKRQAVKALKGIWLASSGVCAPLPPSALTVDCRALRRQVRWSHASQAEVLLGRSQRQSGICSSRQTCFIFKKKSPGERRPPLNSWNGFFIL